VHDLDMLGGLSTTVADSSTILKSVMPTGSVIQVVNATYGTPVSKTNTNTYTDTGLSVSITPTSSAHKVHIFVFQTGIYKSGTDITVRLRLRRDSTDILADFEGTAAGTGDGSNNYVGAAGCVYLDSPSTGSSITYKTQYAANSASGTIGLQGLVGLSSFSTITAMEIRA
jgi:hypothetical protein